VRLALVGAGRQGSRRLGGIERLGQDSIVVVADPDERAGRSLARRAGCPWTPDWAQAVDADADAVLVCNPPDGHAEVTLRALRRGRHVFCEKPLGLTAAAAWEMVDAAGTAGRTLKCGFNYRHHPAIAQAHAWVSAGRIGALTALRCVHGTGGRPSFEHEWRTRAERSGGGILMDQGVHVLDLFRWFAGSFTEALGSVATAYWPIGPVEDNAFAILRGDGLLGTLHVSWTQWKNVFSFEAIGADGTAVVEGLGGSYGVERVILRRPSQGGVREEDVTEFRAPDASWTAEWQEFTAAVAEHREPQGGGRDGALALALVEAIYRSSREGRAAAVGPAIPGTSGTPART